MKINFVVPNNCSYREVNDFSGDVDRDWHFFTNGQWAWIIQTYYRLKKFEQSKFKITISQRLDSECINVIINDDYVKLKDKYKYYCIVPILDRLVFYPGDLTLTQNTNQFILHKHLFVPHWSQPGLIPKDGTNIREKVIVGFYGLPENSENIHEIIESEFSGYVSVKMYGPDCWNDFTKVDIAIGVRSLDSKKYNHKPPTKMFNAWAAGVPFIGGNDSAYATLGIHNTNYIKVSNESELLNAIREIIDNDSFRKNLVNNGTREYCKYDNNSICSHWFSIFSRSDFDSWKRKSVVRRRLEVLPRRINYELLRVKRRLLMVIRRY